MLRNLASLGLTTAIFGTASLAYIARVTSKNQAEYEDVLSSQALKDASRLTNQSFGISWGFQADDTIMDRLDSGDLIFLKYDCTECLSTRSYIICHLHTMLLLQEEYHSVGMCYRDQDGLKILYNQFGNSLIKKYSELVGLPYIKELSIQRIPKGNYPNIHRQLCEAIEGDQPTLFKAESPISFINNLSKRLKLEYTENNQRITDLRELIASEDIINVRTETNRTLRSL